jgi:hypothetical protein
VRGVSDGLDTPPSLVQSLERARKAMVLFGLVHYDYMNINTCIPKMITLQREQMDEMLMSLGKEASNAGRDTYRDICVSRRSHPSREKIFVASGVPMP